MRIETFRHEFKQRNAVMLTDNIMLFRKPLELYDMAADKTIATFKGRNIDVVLSYEINGKTVQQIIESWAEMPVIKLSGGRGLNDAPFLEGHSTKRRNIIDETVVKSANQFSLNCGVVKFFHFPILENKLV